MSDAVLNALTVDEFYTLYDLSLSTINSTRRDNFAQYYLDPQVPWYVTTRNYPFDPALMSTFDSPRTPNYSSHVYRDEPYSFTPSASSATSSDDQPHDFMDWFEGFTLPNVAPQASIFYDDLTTEGVEPNPGPSRLTEINTTYPDALIFNPNPPVIHVAPAQIHLVALLGQALAPLTFYQKFIFLLLLPLTTFYAFIIYNVNMFLPNRFALRLVMHPLAVVFLSFSIQAALGYFATKLLIMLLLLMAGIEPNPGPTQSGSARSREASNTPPVDSSFYEDSLSSRSKEKRNPKFSKRYLSHLLEKQRREKTTTLVRSAQRRLKDANISDPFHYECPTRPVISHNNRRLEQFLESKEKIIPNSFGSILKKITVRCCRPKSDDIYDFLTVRCKLDEMAALALTPIIKAIMKILVNKITVGIALTILAYYIAKHVSVPILILAPLVALILSYILEGISTSVVDAVIKLITKFQEVSSDVHSIRIDDSTFETFTKTHIEHILALDEDSPRWKARVLKYLQSCRLNSYPRAEFSLPIPRPVHDFLQKIDGLTHPERDRLLEKELSDIVPNNISGFCTNVASSIQTLFSSLGLIAATFSLPSALYFYSSSKKFIQQIYGIFNDIYPSVYQFITGKEYVSPEVAKYLKIFGDISTKVHETLKLHRQSNITNLDAKFRVRICNEYEELLESQMKLLALKAPPQLMTPLNNLVRELAIVANHCYGRSKGESSRREPVLTFIRGPPGVGKTAITQALAILIAQRLGMTLDLKADFFIRECDSEFWDGYMSQIFCRLDDAFQVKTPEAFVQTILEVIKMKNQAPYKLNMAALDSKVATFFSSDFVFLNSNVNNVVCDDIADIAAFYRRIDFDVVVPELPPPHADGSPNYDFIVIVNGVESTISRLADSIVAQHKKSQKDDADAANKIAEAALSKPPTDPKDLHPARNSKLDFFGHQPVEHYAKDAAPTLIREHKKASAAATPRGSKTNRGGHDVRPNGWVQKLSAAVAFDSLRTIYSQKVLSNFTTVDKACDAARESRVQCDQYIQFATAFSTWLAVFAVSYASITLISKLIRSLAHSIYPNSKKSKDKLTGDKKSIVVSSSTHVKDQLKATQAAIDKSTIAKVTTKIKPNSSVSRWSKAMISYVNDLGWQNEGWVQQSLANISLLNDFETTSQEKEDLDKLKFNIVEIYTRYKYNGEEFEMYAKALVLNQNHLICPSHQIPATCEVVDIQVIMSNKRINIKECKVNRIENSDTCVLELSTVLPCRDISYMFQPTSQLTANTDEIYLLRNFEDTMTICPVSDFRTTDRIISYETEWNEVVNCGSIFESKIAVCPGDSGCFYVVRKNGRFSILGMHVASSFVAAHGRYISREMLSGYIKPPRTAPTPFDVVKQAIDANSRSFDHILAANSNCIPIGIAHPRTKMSDRSKITRSMLYHHKSLPRPTEFPAKLNRTYDENDVLLKANMKFRLRSEPHVDATLRNEIVHALLDEHPNTATSKFYSNTESIEGAENMPHMNFTTSSAYPYSTMGRTPKTKLTLEDWVEISKICDQMLEDLYNGLMPQSLFQTSFKDEPREAAKVDAPRVINCAQVALTMLFRRVLGPWMNMIHANHKKLRTKVGINAHGDDWKVFFDTLCAINPDNIVELDYSGYEYNHPQFSYLIAADFIYRLYLRSGFSERDAQAARLLIQSCAGGFVLQNEVIIFVWMLLSGLPITAELNSLLNEIYQMIAYKKLTGNSLVEMRKHVASGFYGDDLLHAVSDDIKHLFNALTIQKFCAEFLSMKVTPASNKMGEMTPFVSILDCSFLCRKFAPRENRVDAPLKLESCTNSLQYYIPVSHMNQKELLASKCRSFITELTHYPPQIYDHWTDILSQIKAQNGLDFICYDYPAALAKRVVMTEF